MRGSPAFSDQQQIQSVFEMSLTMTSKQIAERLKLSDKVIKRVLNRTAYSEFYVPSGLMDASKEARRKRQNSSLKKYRKTQQQIINDLKKRLARYEK